MAWADTGTGGTGGTPVACTPMAPTPRRLWRLSVEQWGPAVKDLLGLTAAPMLSNRGGQAAYAFFSDATLGVDAEFQFALYKASQNDVLPRSARLTTLAPCTGTGHRAAGRVREDLRGDHRGEGVPASARAPRSRT